MTPAGTSRQKLAKSSCKIPRRSTIGTYSVELRTLTGITGHAARPVPPPALGPKFPTTQMLRTERIESFLSKPSKELSCAQHAPSLIAKRRTSNHQKRRAELPDHSFAQNTTAALHLQLHSGHSALLHCVRHLVLSVRRKIENSKDVIVTVVSSCISLRGPLINSPHPNPNRLGMPGHNRGIFQNASIL